MNNFQPKEIFKKEYSVTVTVFGNDVVIESIDGEEEKHITIPIFFLYGFADAIIEARDIMFSEETEKEERS